MMWKIPEETEDLIKLIMSFFEKSYPVLRKYGVEKIETTDMNLL